MAALSLSSTAVTRPSKAVVNFDPDEVMDDSKLASEFYQDDSCSTNSSERKNSAVGFSIDLSDTAISDDNFGEADINENSGCGDGAKGGAGRNHKKFLTAKYKKQKMGMVRRRIEVEDWIDGEMRRLFDLPEDSYETYDAELDLDELLEMSSEEERISYIKTNLSEAPKSAIEIDAFVEELLGKISSL